MYSLMYTHQTIVLSKKLIFRCLKQVINTFSDTDNDIIIMGGDMNCILFKSIDQKGSVDKVDKSVYTLKHLINLLQLSDVWREQHPSKMQFTWRRKVSQIYRRLDFWLVSRGVVNCGLIASSDIRPSILTGHQAISIKIDLRVEKRGPGLWKFNANYLKDEVYINGIKHIIRNTATNTLNPSDKWELIEIKIKEYSITHGKSINKNKIYKKEKIVKVIKQLHVNLINDYKENDEIELEIKEKQLENIYHLEARGAQIRSRVRWTEQGERNNKYFPWS